ncbi:hypothetical protein ColKHC_01429 [Colletotrichum higginsianum]|nr:hypothetical protein ColKHC_01429 [Colletotrichum higginsianum]
MRPSAPLPLLLSVSTAANAIPLLDRLLHLRADAKPTKTYLVVNVEGSPSTDAPQVVTVTQSPAKTTVTERVTDTAIITSPAAHTTETAQTTSTSTSLVVVNVDATTDGGSTTTITVYPTVTPSSESTPQLPAELCRA